MNHCNSRHLSSRVLKLPRVTSSNGGHRIEMVVGGNPLWFESPDAILHPSIEAFVIAMLFPASHRAVRLQADTPVDTRLLRGLGALTMTYAAWWNLPADTCELLVGGDRASVPSPSDTGLCFSSGVDSFYSLLTRPDSVDVLVLVHGFDIPLNDQRRWRHAETSLRRVGSAFGKRTVTIRTNLRAHGLFKGVSWQRAHGAALAAAGHALASVLGTLRIPPSYRADRLQPWGSDPRTDPLYSSSRLRIEHPPAKDGRPERIARIARHRIVQRNLRVCYENRAPVGNCSRCEKCVSTMTVLDALGELEAFECFDRSLPLHQCLDRLPCIAHHSVDVWQDIANMHGRPEVVDAVQRLLERRPPRQLKRIYHRVQRWLRQRCA